MTDINISYSFSGCSGVKTCSGLSLAIATPPNPTSPGPGFGYGSETRDGTNYTQVAGWFTSDRTAVGTAGFVEFPGCGSGGGNWGARNSDISRAAWTLLNFAAREECHHGLLSWRF